MWVTVFDFNMQKTGKPYLRMGTGGKYLRFALTQENNKVDVKIKINKDESRSIEVEIDNTLVEAEIEFDEG
jgi:endonuclease/exonuclease/phosphatase family metal-dependent hydrolase